MRLDLAQNIDVFNWIEFISYKMVYPIEIHLN